MAEKTTAPATGYDAVCKRMRPRCGWASYGWPTKVQADVRLAEHEAEHRSGDAAPELFLSESLLADLPPDEVTMRFHIHDKASN